MINVKNYKSAMLSGVLITPMCWVEASELKPEWLLSAGWQSKYVTEGRNNLAEGGLRYVLGSVAVEQTDIHLWVGQGTKEQYQEVNLSVVQNIQHEHWQGYVGLARLAFTEVNQYDTELSFGLAFSNYQLWVPSIDYVYSTEAEGGFVMLMANLQPVLINEQLSFFSSVGLGLDFGYASDQHDGLNHAEFGAGLHWALSDKIHTELTLGYSHPLQDVRLDMNQNQSWLALSFNSQF